MCLFFKRTEGIDIESEEIPEALSQVIETLSQHLGSGEVGRESSIIGNDLPLAKAICAELLVRVSTVPKALTALKDAASVMLASGADDRSMQVTQYIFYYLSFLIP